MRRLICVIVVLFVICSLCACKGDDYSLLNGYERNKTIPVYDFISGENETPEAYEEYAAGTTEFAFELLSQFADEQENVALSPHSAATALSLLVNGTSGSTLRQFREVLCQGKSTQIINSGNYYLNSRLSAFNTEQSKLNLANSVWLDDSFDVKPTFLQTAVNYYDADVNRVVLKDAVDSINNWISKNTDGEINDLVSSIDEATRMIIVNTALFDDEWVIPYGENQINDGVFHGTKGDVTASYMTSQEAYLETSFAKGYTKGFANLPLKFAALLPAEDTDFTDFVENLTVARWQSLLGSQEAATFCRVSVPRFDIKTQYSLTDSLMKMGLTDIFDTDKADFSALSYADSIFVSEVTQEAFVKVDAKGTQAGAATVIHTAPSAARPTEEIKSLVFDQPFVFVIYDNESGIPVFTGIVNTIE